MNYGIASSVLPQAHRTRKHASLIQMRASLKNTKKRKRLLWIFKIQIERALLKAQFVGGIGRWVNHMYCAEIFMVCQCGKAICLHIMWWMVWRKVQEGEEGQT